MLLSSLIYGDSGPRLLQFPYHKKAVNALTIQTAMTDLESRKALGRAHLNADRLQDALQVYSSIMREYPEDVEARLFLGDCYLAGGDGETARNLYEQARALDPTYPEIENRLRLAATLLSGRSAAEGAVPTNPAAIARLLQRLTGSASPITDEEVARAARMLQDILRSPEPAQEVARRLEEVDALLPALLELNIRQARADGRPELVRPLEELLHYIDLQVRVRREDMAEPDVRSTADVDVIRRRILFLMPATGTISPRQHIALEAIESRGLHPDIATAAEIDRLRAADVVMLFDPHTSASAMEALAMCAGSRVPVVVDLSDNFESMPVDHPAYAERGLGTPEAAKAYTAAIQLADVISVPSRMLAESLGAAGRQVEVVPDGWSRRNELWQKTTARRRALNIGWLGCAGCLEDLALVRRAIIRLMREFSHVQLMIGGDPSAYQLFETMPETRRQYLPPAHAEDYPYLLSQVDVLLLPYRNTAYHHSLSDRAVMEAGVKAVPWIASPIPAFVDWAAGGLIASAVDEWHLHMRTLVLDESLRASLAVGGQTKAGTREASRLGEAWETLLRRAIQARASAGKGRGG
jgi:tetratricopeptide (TPR) repeat protein